MDSAFLGLAAADDWERNKEENNNRLAAGLIGGAALLGAGALGVNYARSVAKNRTRKAQANVSDNMPRSGQGGVQRMDLSALPEQTKAGVYKRASESYPDPGAGKDVQYRNPGSGGTDLSMLVTDPNTGEVYRRGGGQSLNQQQAAPRNQGGGINLSKQNLMGQGSLTTDQLMSFGQRQSSQDVNYLRNRIASDLEAGPQSFGPNVQLRNLPPANRVDRLISEIGIDEMGRMTAGPEYAKEAGQMTATESSRQSRIVKQMEKKDSEFERIAKNILAEMQGGGGQGVAKQPKPSGGGGPKLAGYSEGPIDAADKAAIQASRRDRPGTLVEVRESSKPFVRTAQNEAVQTANDQRDLQIIKHIQRNEDVDLTHFNEDILDKRVAEARSYLQRQEIDLDYDYSSEVARQAADVGAALERIRNNPKRVAAEGVISELQAIGRAERDLARFQSEGLKGGELSGLKAEDNTRQRSEQQGSRSMTGEQLEEVLLGEGKVVDSNMRGRALRGGKVNAEGSVIYVGEGGAETGDFRDASTGVRTDIPFVASGPKTPEGAASILASEAIRKEYQNQRPEPLRGPAADVGRSMQTLREGMSVEPSEVLPSTQVPTINRGGYADGEAVIVAPVETAFTGDAVDAAGPVLFTGKNKRDSAVVGTSPPLTQETVVSNPQAAAQNESIAQSFLSRAIGGGLAEKQTETYVYEPAKIVKVGSVAAPYLDTGKAAGGAEGVDASQRLGYTRYNSESNPLGTPSTGATTVSINYAELPQLDVYRPGDIGRINPSLSSRPKFVASVPTPKAVMPVDAGPVRKSYPADPNQTYAPEALAGRQASVVYPHMRGKSLFSTGTLMNDPDLRGGPVKFEGREYREDEYVRPIAERLGRGDTMTRFPIIRRG